MPKSQNKTEPAIKDNNTSALPPISVPEYLHFLRFISKFNIHPPCTWQIKENNYRIYIIMLYRKYNTKPDCNQDIFINSIIFVNYAIILCKHYYVNHYTSSHENGGISRYILQYLAVKLALSHYILM